MAKIIYLHGFASVGVGEKSNKLREELPSDLILSPDLPIDPKQVISIVDNIVSENFANLPVIFVGTSLGGFWANYFAHKYDSSCVIVNPAVSPSKTMKERINQKFNNYKTGEEITITEEHVDQFSQLEKEVTPKLNPKLINVFLAKNDDVIDFQKTLDYLPCYQHILVTDDGGHRYEKYWNLVVQRVKELTEI